VLSISSELVMQLDSSLRIIFANEPLLNLVETDSKTLLGKNIEYTPVALVFDEAFTGFLENIREGINGKEWAGDIELTIKDLIFFCRIAPTVFDDGRKGVSVLLEDITGEKRAEMTLKESEDRYRKLVEISPDAVFLHREGKIIYANPAAFKLLGTSRSDKIIGKSILDFIHPDFREAVRNNIQKDLRDTITPHIELHMLRVDGSSVIVEGRGVKTTIDGKPAVQVAIRDITERKRVEEILRKSEEQYRSLVETTGTGYVILDKEGRVITANQEYVRLTGRSTLAEIEKRPVTDWTASYDIERNVQEIDDCFRKGWVRDFEVDYQKPDGTIQPIEVNASVIQSDSEQIILTLCRDITERKCTEEALRESEGKLNAMLQSIPDIMSMMDEDLTIVWANEPAKRYFGKDIIGKKCYEVYHLRRDPCEPYPCLTLKAFLDGKTHEHETTVIDNEGENRFFECTATVALRDNSGKPVAVLETSRDITDKKKTEDALRESEARIRLILDSTDDIIIMQNPEGRYLFFNSAARYGVSEEEMLGKTPYDFLDRESADLIVERVKKVAKTGRSIREESPLVWKGQTLWFNDSLSPVRGVDGTITAVVTISQNITDRRNAEEALIHNEQRYRNLITAIGDIIWETDAQSRFVYVSPQVETILGYTPDELIGHTPFEFLHPDSIGHNHKTFQTAVERHEKSFLHVSQWIHKDGHKILLESNAIPRYDGKGSFSGFIGIDRQRQ
jgi:PAS domain S-box-containing protein